MERDMLDQTYLTTEQYRTSASLANRSSLHERYGTSPVPFREWEAALVDWEPHWNVLEVGCGPGRFWGSDRLPRSLGLTLTDLSAGMVDEAVAAAKAHGYQNVSGETCDAQSLPFPDGSFDAVVANHMLYHVPEPDVALAEIRRVLVPGGIAVVATNSPGHMRQLNEECAEVFGRQTMVLNERFGVDPGELMLREVFAEITYHAFVNRLRVTSVDDLVAYATSFPPGAQATPDEVCRLREAFERASAARDGVFTIDTRAGLFLSR